MILTKRKLKLSVAGRPLLQELKDLNNSTDTKIILSSRGDDDMCF